MAAMKILAGRGYQDCGVIGMGSYSKVRKVVKDGVAYACKVVKKNDEDEEYWSKFVPRELRILRKIRHHHIAKVYEIIEEPRRVCIVMELAKEDLWDKLQNEGHLSEARAHELFMQMTCGIAYLHRNDVAHRDLKPENVLLTTDGKAKLTDFGYGRFCTSKRTGRKVLSSTFCGGGPCTAPEILQDIPYEPKMVDMWGLGVLLHLMVTAEFPFGEEDLPRQIELQLSRSIHFPKEITLADHLVHLISLLLEPVVARRATIDVLIKHPWVNKFPSGHLSLKSELEAKHKTSSQHHQHDSGHSQLPSGTSSATNGTRR
ncbi:testis-specific serine/threonine-protein kinase 3-like [Ornithodoros turicata]|uniref:testis-specific serine/threonine-protein kinase 3-like n=1 Tax=Ornithodoros turicata TaxID=34597 RepID=UPI003138E957